VSVDGFINCCVSSTVDETEDVMLWNDSAEDGNVSSELKKMKALTVKMDTADNGDGEGDAGW
jgi:hypothetical protein